MLQILQPPNSASRTMPTVRRAVGVHLMTLRSKLLGVAPAARARARIAGGVRGAEDGGSVGGEVDFRQGQASRDAARSRGGAGRVDRSARADVEVQGATVGVRLVPSGRDPRR